MPAYGTYVFTPVSAPVANSIGAGVAFDGVKYYALFHNVSTTTNTYYDSPDGIVWTARTLPAYKTYSYIYAAGSTVYAFFESSSGAYYTTNGGATWTLVSPALTVSAASGDYVVANGSNLFCPRVGSAGAFVGTSITAMSWNPSVISGRRISEADAGGGYFWVVSGLNAGYVKQATLLKSADGVTWTEYAMPDATTYPRRVAYYNGVVYVACDRPDSAPTDYVVYMYAFDVATSTWSGGRDARLSAATSVGFLFVNDGVLVYLFNMYDPAIGGVRAFTSVNGSGADWSTPRAFSGDFYSLPYSRADITEANGKMFWTSDSGIFLGAHLPPPPPNNSEAIVFDMLVDSPYEELSASVPLPQLKALASDQTTFGVADLPLLTVAASGDTTLRYDGNAAFDLSLLRTYASDATVGLVVDYTANAWVDLPSLAAYAEQADDAFVPSDAWASVTLSPMTAVATAASRNIGSAIAQLPPLTTIALQASGPYAVIELPALSAQASNLPPPTNRGVLAPSFLAMAGVADGSIYNVVQDEVALVSGAVGTPVVVLVENLRLTGTPYPRLTLHARASDTMEFDGALAVIWRVLAESGLNLTGEIVSNASKMVRVMDTLLAGGVVSSHLEAKVAVSSAVAINSLIATGWKVDAADTVTFSDAFQAQVTAVVAVLDSIQLQASASPSLHLTAVVDDTVVLGADSSVSLEMFERVVENVLFHGVIRLGDDEYVGWVLNEGAPSEYRNYPFNGFVEFDGRYYGTAREGLFLLEGEDDAGDPIAASIKTALMDFGTGALKRVPDVYVAFAGGDSLVLKVITTGQRGEQVETLYTAAVPPDSSALHNGYVRIGQGLTSRYWQFELANVDGADFEIDELAWRPMTLDRRV